MKIINKKRIFILTVSMFVVLIIGERYIGIVGVANLYPTYTYSWSEINNNVLFFLLGSLFFALSINSVLEWLLDVDKKDIENARKRIEERERLEKDNQKSETEIEADIGKDK